jgi:hypothetical protein
MTKGQNMSTKTLISEGQHLAREHKVVSREEWIGARKETTLMEPCYFLGDGNSANFTLDFLREGLGPKSSGRITARLSVLNGKRFGRRRCCEPTRC